MYRFGLLWLVIGMLAACAHGPANREGSRDVSGKSVLPVTSYLIFDTKTGERIAEDALKRRFIETPWLLWGEQHDQPLHHLLRGRWLSAWAGSRPQHEGQGLNDRAGRAIIVFEHLDREHDAALRQLQQRQPDAPVQALLDEARFDGERWGGIVYRPLFVAARDSGLPWVAANLSRRSAQQWMKAGGNGKQAADTVDWLRQRLPALPAPEDAGWLALLGTADWDDQAEAQLIGAVRQGHCDALPEAMLVPMASAQRLRDAALAEGVRQGDGPAAMLPPRLLLAGNGHVDRRFGVPRYLGVDQRQVLVLGMLQWPALTSSSSGVEGSEGADAHAAGGAARTGAAPRSARAGTRLADWVGDTRAASLASAYDVVVLTPVTPGAAAPDHCAVFRQGKGAPAKASAGRR